MKGLLSKPWIREKCHATILILSPNTHEVNASLTFDYIYDVYRIAGILFRGYKCSWFSRIRHEPRTLKP